MFRQIIAQYDDQGIVVYQAYGSPIADAALANGRFTEPFSFDRMTWIKPSFAWMLHRSSYAMAKGQERILAIKLPHEFFLRVLKMAVLSSYKPDIYPQRQDWDNALRTSPVRCQWDPDRDWANNKLERRAIQLGLAGPMVREYVSAIISVVEVTELAHRTLRYREAREQLPPPEYPREQRYPVPPGVAEHLRIDSP